MSRYAEILNLDRENLETLGSVYMGYGEILSRGEIASDYPYIASCFTIAGVYKAVLNQEESRICFQKAANFYQKENNDYWIICSLCATDFYQGSHLSMQNDKFDFRKLENLYLQKYLNSDSENNGSNPIGRLLIPQKMYLDALREINRLDSNEIRINKVSSFIGLYNRLAEFIYTLKGDSYHWNSLYGNFVPIEPESIAFSKIVVDKLSSKDISMREFLERTDLNYISRIPLEIAGGMNR